MMTTFEFSEPVSSILLDPVAIKAYKVWLGGVGVPLPGPLAAAVTSIRPAQTDSATNLPGINHIVAS